MTKESVIDVIGFESRLWLGLMNPGLSVGTYGRDACGCRARLPVRRTAAPAGENGIGRARRVYCVESRPRTAKRSMPGGRRPPEPGRRRACFCRARRRPGGHVWRMPDRERAGFVVRRSIPRLRRSTGVPRVSWLRSDGRAAFDGSSAAAQRVEDRVFGESLGPPDTPYALAMRHRRSGVRQFAPTPRCGASSS